MQFLGASIFLAIVLLVAAASLASYLAGQWNRSGGALARSALTVGAALLLAASIFGVIAVSWLSLLRIPLEARLQQMLDRSSEASIGRPPSSGAAPASQKPRLASDAAAQPAVNREGAASRELLAGALERFEDEQTIAGVNAPTARQNSNAAAAYAGASSPSPDPWAATSCVVAINLDPDDLSRWTLENDCDAPVGVVLATCAESIHECATPRSTSWRYEPKGMILPAKHQRPTTAAEQTRIGRGLRYVACFVTSPDAVRLIGMSIAEQTSSSRAPEFAMARESDECLARVEQWSDAGRRSGLSIDALIGPGLPGSLRGERM